MPIKKACQPIVDLLNKHLDRPISDVIDEVITLASAKARSAKGPRERMYIMHEDKPVAVKCYYFQRWMPIVGSKAVEFGTKAGNKTTGLNNMCKEGVSNWTKQNKALKDSERNIFAEVKKGNIAPTDIEAKEKAEAKEIKKIAKTDLGFETRDEVIAYLAKDAGMTIEL